MNKILALFLAAAGLAMVPLTQADAAEPMPVRVSVPVNGTNYFMPATVRVNETVVVERHRSHRRYRTVRKVIYRHGHRTVVTRRVYY